MRPRRCSYVMELSYLRWGTPAPGPLQAQGGEQSVLKGSRSGKGVTEFGGEETGQKRLKCLVLMLAEAGKTSYCSSQPLGYCVCPAGSTSLPWTSGCFQVQFCCVKLDNKNFFVNSFL